MGSRNIQSCLTLSRVDALRTGHSENVAGSNAIVEQVDGIYKYGLFAS